MLYNELHFSAKDEDEPIHKVLQENLFTDHYVRILENKIVKMTKALEYYANDTSEVGAVARRALK
jgi:hypothetical protein